MRMELEIAGCLYRSLYQNLLSLETAPQDSSPDFPFPSGHRLCVMTHLHAIPHLFLSYSGIITYPARRSPDMHPGEAS